MFARPGPADSGRPVGGQPGLARAGVTGARCSVTATGRRADLVAAMVAAMVIDADDADELGRQFLTDPPTGLVNRVLLVDRLTQALNRGVRRETDTTVVVLALDGLEELKDGFGDAAGDYVVQVVADRLRAAVRTMDTVARYATDKFVVVAEAVSDPDELVERIMATISQPVSIDGQSVWVAASVGVASSDGPDAATLLGQADAALGGTTSHRPSATAHRQEA